MLAIFAEGTGAAVAAEAAEAARASMSGETFMGMLIGLVTVVLIFSTPIVIVLASLRQRTVKQKLINELVLKLAEKGQPVPPELFLDARQERARGPRRGIIWMAVGIGLIVCGAVSDNNDALSIGFIPLMIGLGYYLAARLEQKQDEKK